MFFFKVEWYSKETYPIIHSWISLWRKSLRLRGDDDDDDEGKVVFLTLDGWVVWSGLKKSLKFVSSYKRTSSKHKIALLKTRTLFINIQQLMINQLLIHCKELKDNRFIMSIQILRNIPCKSQLMLATMIMMRMTIKDEILS